MGSARTRAEGFRFNRRQGMLATAAGLAGAGLLSTAADSGETRAAKPDESFPVPGLHDAVEILEDRYGVPHIYAASQQDAFLAQGFNAARARLFQIDLWRRRGLGLLAEAFGPDYAAQDRATRLFLYRGDMATEWSQYGTDAQRIAQQFTTGINAYIDWLAIHPEHLPEEFRVLGHQPAHWQPEDVVRIRSHGLTRNLTSEVRRCRVAATAGVEADTIRQGLEPDRVTTVPDGLNPDEVPADVLATFELATQDVEFHDGALRARAPRDPTSEGSNNWVIGGQHTTSGRPILANDPHRSYAAPGLRYLAHLNAPGMNVIGAGEPALPGISIGHNEQIAFGLTIFPMDQEDLYVYELDPADHTRYRYNGGWERMRVEQETVPVTGAADQEVQLAFTRHGPVIYLDEEHDRAYAVRTVWLRPGTAPYFGSIGYMRAGDHAEFLEAMQNWAAPTENQVYADTDGNIGWVPSGVAPRRRGYDGLLPVPGDGRYEWDGFWSGSDLPRAFNPTAGYIATANQFNLPADYPLRTELGFEWTNPFRHQRIMEVLTGTRQHDLRTSARLQNDQLSLPARRITSLLRHLTGPDANTRRALRLLRSWDHVVSAESAAAALFEVWLTRHLGPAFVRATVPAAAEHIDFPDTLVMLNELEHPGHWLDDESARNRLLLNSLRAAHVDTRELLGRAEHGWQWGRLQHSYFAHPASTALNPATRARFDVGPFPRGGSADTVNQSSYDSTNFQQENGPSFRMVLDVGDWDAAMAVNAPGQSGNPNDPHYSDLVERWRTGEYFQLAYTRAAVEPVTERRLRLDPS